MTTPPPPRESAEGFVAEHQSMDDRLEAAFRRYDAAFHAERTTPELLRARMDLSLLLWGDEDAPPEVQQQLASDGQQLLRETPPL